MTETTSVITTIGGSSSPPTSVGRLMPSIEMKIIGRSEQNLGENLSINEIGEILVRGPLIMKGYFKNPQATLDSIVEGDWLKTGDLGSFDENGNLSIHGRIKELIKVNGMQVSPSELEDLLRGYDKISDVAVIGVPHEKFGEIPKAFIVKKEGADVSEDNIKNYVFKRVVEYKRLGKVVFVQKIPKNIIGKTLKKELYHIKKS